MSSNKLTQNFEQVLVESSLAQNKTALKQFVDYLTPTIHVRITRALLRWCQCENSSRQRHLIEDLTQEVFLELFRDNGRVLRTWDPDKGAALKTFVGLIAERKTHSHLRVKKNAYYDDGGHELESTPSHEEPEKQFETEHQIEQLILFVKDEISELGREIFTRLFLQEETVEDVCAELSMSPDAVYAWRSRLRKKIEQWRLDYEEAQLHQNNRVISNAGARP